MHACVPELFGSRIINNIFSGGFVSTAEDYVKSHNLIDLKYQDSTTYLITPDPAVDSGKWIDGITEGFAGKASDIGAIEKDKPMWKVGHDFSITPKIDTVRSKPLHRNLLINAAFEHEDHLSPWVKDGNVRINKQPGKYQTTPDTASVRMGAYSLELLPKGIIYQEISSLLPDQDYCFATALRVDKNEAVVLGVSFSDGSEVTSTAVGYTENGWARGVVNFSSGSQTTVKCFIKRTTAGKGQV